ncbi:MAG: DUF4338 domain-containing protein [Candidatus Bathyarchaeota archaeon]|nr:DUF4338 domain-containing protein [Candidatus Bathyarchaeota archaeon]
MREKIIAHIKSEGFCVNPHLVPKCEEKSILRKIHEQKKLEQLTFHRSFLLKNMKIARNHTISGKELNPKRIDLELVEVKPNTIESRLFFWWNLIWWSLPFDKPIGRQMRFILWDKGHNAPFGLLYLQSPPLRSPPRDRFLELTGTNIDYWINQSMYAQRVGALPPYNQLIGGKMVALSLVSNEIRDLYACKYGNRETLMSKRKIPANLLFVTTSSAYGKSSMYDRIVYNKDQVSSFIGFTSGAGTFHISEKLYLELLAFLKENNIETKRGYGTGTSRKLRLISKALCLLGLPKFSFHNIKRGYYIFPNVSNLYNVIHFNEKPIWYNRSFSDLFQYWKIRWCLPRSERDNRWQNFCPDTFFEETLSVLSE